jgi:hypothetical protein
MYKKMIKTYMWKDVYLYDIDKYYIYRRPIITNIYSIYRKPDVFTITTDRFYRTLYNSIQLYTRGKRGRSLLLPSFFPCQQKRQQLKAFHVKKEAGFS